MKKTTKIRIFHAMLANAGLMAQKPDMLASYGVSSTLDLTEAELDQLMDKLREVHSKKQKDLEAARRRVMAAIGAYLRREGRPEHVANIKAIALRAAGCDDFNKIPLSKLRAIYSEFVKQNRAGKSAQMITSEEIERKTLMN